MNIRDITAEILSETATPLTAVEICALIKRDRNSDFVGFIQKYKTMREFENALYGQAKRVFQDPANSLARSKLQSDFGTKGIDGKRTTRFWVGKSGAPASPESGQYSLSAECNANIESVPRGTEVGAGFGDPAENKLVEDTAIRVVTQQYRSSGWSVRSVEQQKCGFDLDCRKNETVEHVEVKGVRGDILSFIITASEVKQARENTKFVLMVVTSALSATPKLSRFAGAEVCRRFDLAAVHYRAVLKA